MENETIEPVRKKGGRKPKPPEKKSYRWSFTFPFDLHNFLNSLEKGRRSEFVVKAVREKTLKEVGYTDEEIKKAEALSGVQQPKSQQQ